MSKSLTLEEYILQTDFVEHIEGKLGKETWLTCYESYENDTDFGKESYGAYCALIPVRKVSKVLEGFGWDLNSQSHGPGFSISHPKGKEIIKYHRFTCSNNYLPLVIRRDFSGVFEAYYEVLEEFRLFHNLFEDKKTGNFFKIIDDSGNTAEVVRVGNKKVEIRLLEIRQFLAAKKMALASYFEKTRYSKDELPETLSKKKIATEVREKDHGFVRYGENHDFSYYEAQSFSRVCGKKIIRPIPIEKCGIWPFTDHNDGYEEFIIDVDENGDNVLSTCDENQLANYFGANPDAPHYLTPVFFQRDVLAKYYANTERYEIEDGQLRCRGFWSLRLDNNHPDHIMVYLGDLGHMPFTEQKHWRSFNLSPEERTMSRAYYMRSILGQPYETESPDLRFKRAFENLQKKWKKNYGWDLFLPLSKEDRHYFSSLRVPLNEQQSEFDHQVHGLAKVLVDSINVNGLIQHYGLTIPEEMKGKPNSLYVFEQFLKAMGIFEAEGYIKFLRDIQALRSSGTAHRKGSNYKKIMDRLDVQTHGYKVICVEVFYTGERLLQDLMDSMPDQSLKKAS